MVIHHISCGLSWETGDFERRKSLNMERETKERKQCRVLSIGAHPDDADTSAGGLLFKLYHQGWEVRMLSATDGSAGMYDASRCGKPLADRRRAEAAASGRLLGGVYDVWDIEDGRLMASLENRERLIRYIRRFQPDLILTNRPGDYHPDHRNTAQLVADASYLLTIPYICSDTAKMNQVPVILYWSDDFQRPYPFQPDVVVPIDGLEEKRLSLACCHESQYFDWLYWPDQMDHRQWPREQQVEELRQNYLQRSQWERKMAEEVLVRRFGQERAASIQAVECYEICEFGEPLSDQLREILESDI
jgi:LmbE family N-acetylglucosaminyl deacetylase